LAAKTHIPLYATRLNFFGCAIYPGGCGDSGFRKARENTFVLRLFYQKKIRRSEIWRIFSNQRQEIEHAGLGIRNANLLKPDGKIRVHPFQHAGDDEHIADNL
jgi:hypothetical protein